MKTKTLLALGVLIGTVFAVDKIILKKPPQSLQKYYPPQSKSWEYVSNMQAMSVALTGIRININNGEWEKAKRWAENFRDTYIKTSEMVPEWKSYYKPELANMLVKAVERKDTDKVIKLSREIGQTCNKCHTENQIAVKLLYHFPSFKEVKILDPEELTELETKEYMRKMTDSMKALIVFLLQDDTEKARNTGFITRAKELSQMCSKCHTDELSKEVIMGRDYERALSNIHELLSREKIDKQEILKNLKVVGLSCNKCHDVHLVPAMVRESFEKKR